MVEILVVVEDFLVDAGLVVEGEVEDEEGTQTVDRRMVDSHTVVNRVTMVMARALDWALVVVTA